MSGITLLDDDAEIQDVGKASQHTLVEKRQKIQFAADANVGLRKEFDLPATRPYSA